MKSAREEFCYPATWFMSTMTLYTDSLNMQFNKCIIWRKSSGWNSLGNWQVLSLSDGHRGNSEKSSETGENLFSHRKPQSSEREICKITSNRDNQNGNHQHENRDQIEKRNNKFWLQNNLKFAGLYFLIEKFKQMKWKNKENCKSKSKKSKKSK